MLLDGKDIRDFNRADYYTMFSAVFQSFSLLAGTIAANVAQTDVGIDMERVKECVEKAGTRNSSRLQFLVLITLGSAALIALGSALLDKWKGVQNVGMWKVEFIFLEKLFDMDYASLDETETAELLSTIRQNQNGGGWGLYRVIGNYETLCSSVLTILGGISLTVSLFMSRVPESAGAYTVLNNSLFVILVIVVMLLITYLAPALSNKAGSYWALNADSHNLGNRLFSFFGWLGYNRDIATDVRMYRQDIICEKYNRNKEDAFGSNGLFAHLCLGPIGLYKAAASAISVVFTGAVYVFVCLKAWAGAFGLGAVTQYVASITKLSGGVSDLISTLGDMRNNATFLEQVYETICNDPTFVIPWIYLYTGDCKNQW